MGRGQDSKLRRRANRKGKSDDDEGDIFGDGTTTSEQNEDTDEIPLPPKMKKASIPVTTVTEDDSSSDEQEEAIDLPKKKTRKPRVGGGGGGDSSKEGIKTTPLILLIIMMGSTVLPALIFASDYIGNYMARNNVLGNVGFRLGIGAVPRRRVLSFYEKHAPEKLSDVPNILAKNYGDYPTLIKKLERKYQDYGYFIGWEEDEAPLTLALEQVRATYDAWLSDYWNRYAPQVLKTGARNVRYNLTFLYKKGHKIWKKHVWPMLEPFLGVPKGIEKQKRKDAAEARKRQEQKTGKRTGGRRKNTDYRDDVGDEN